jgi:uroporphyrinogen decarboxylase
VNSKSIITAGIKRRKTPRPPVMILSGGVWANKRYNLSLEDSFHLSPQTAAEHVIETNNLIHSDLIWTAAGCNNLVLRGIGAKTCFSQTGVAASIVEPLINNASDVDKLNISDIENDPGIQTMLEMTRILKEKVGNEYLIGISQWGALTLAGLLIGTDNFMIMSLRDKQAAEYILSFTEKLVIKYWSLFIEAGAELVSQAEPSASCNMISPRQFESMAVPHIRNNNRNIDNKVKYKMLHICGDISRLLPVLPQCESDVISFDYKVSLSAARENLNGKMAFAGKLDPVGVLLTGSPDEIRAITKSYIEEAGDGGGYIVMPGCDLAPATPIENIQAMTETALNYKY